MQNQSPTIRKAAILLRSLDSETAAVLLTQLSPTEARAVRAAIRSLGSIDPEEQAEVMEELRGTSPIATTKEPNGVELDLQSFTQEPEPTPGKPFDFLEQAHLKTLVSYLTHEHVQTVAVVLSYLKPVRAAEVLAALPKRCQAETIERLAMLGETDADSLKVVEQEIAAWVTKMQATQTPSTHRVHAAAAVLAEVEETVRHSILGNLKQQNRHLAEKLTPVVPKELKPLPKITLPPKRAPQTVPPKPSLPPFQFEDLVHLDTPSLAAVMQKTDAQVLQLALADSSEALIARIAGQMPRKVAKAFRDRLYGLPMRLSDVAEAKRLVAQVAATVVNTNSVRRVAT